MQTVAPPPSSVLHAAIARAPATALPDGTFAPDDSIRPRLRVTVLIGGIGAEVISARVPLGFFAGLIQVDVRIPAGAPSGPAVSLEMGVGDVLSPPTTLAIR